MSDSPPVPMWFLDFDGVVNAITRSPYKAIWGDWVNTRMRGYSIWYSPTVVDYIARVAASGVRVVWLTTWGEWTSDFPRLLPGMPALPYLDTPPGPQESWPDGLMDEPWWKLQRVQENASDGRAFVWTDDDLRHHHAPGHAAHQWATGTPGQLVRPRANLGLIPRDLRVISQTLAEHGYDVPAPTSQTG